MMQYDFGFVKRAKAPCVMNHTQSQTNLNSLSSDDRALSEMHRQSALKSISSNAFSVFCRVDQSDLNQIEPVDKEKNRVIDWRWIE